MKICIVLVDEFMKWVDRADRSKLFNRADRFRKATIKLSIRVDGR
jgi:hypothetical protein